MLQQVERSGNDLRAVLGAAREQLAGVLARPSRASAAADPRPATEPWPRPRPLANAKRRRREGRSDDAVARLELKERYGIENTSRVRLDQLPETLPAKWASPADSGVVTLGLQRAYELLQSWNDPLAKRFMAAGLGSDRSLLVARNQSILAHVFQRVRHNVFESLWRAALEVCDVDEASLPSFPSLAQSTNG